MYLVKNMTKLKKELDFWKKLDYIVGVKNK